MPIGKVVRSLKIRILPNTEQKKLLKQYAGTARYLHNQAKALAEGVFDRARATAIAGWEAEHDGTCKGEIAAKACNKLKCKMHGEASGCATQKHADSGKNRCWFVKERHKCCGDVIDREAMPGSKLRYFCEDHVPESMPSIRGKITSRNRRLEAMEEAVGVCQHKGCDTLLCDDLEVGEIYKYYCDDHSEIYADKIPKVPVPMSVWSFQSLRNFLVPPNDELPEDKRWMADTPFNTRQLSVKKYSEAVSSFFKLRQVNPRAQMPRFKSKKAPTQTFGVDANSVSYRDGIVRLCPTVFPGAVVVDGKTVRGSVNIKHKNKKRLLKEMNKEGIKLGDAEIKFDELGRWFIIQPIIRNSHEHPVECIPNDEKPFAQVYIDPGVRTGITGYCPEGVAFKMGDELFELVKNKLIKADKCMSAADLLKNSGGKNRKIKRIRRRAQALRTKVQAVRRDVHRKICRFLCDNFATVFLPKLDAVSLSAVGGRNISSQTIRKMMTFAHGEFRVFLEAYAKVRGVAVVNPSEAFTTKTCTGCGFVREVGGVHTLHCDSCGLTIDRDLSAARSLSLRCLAAPNLVVT